MKILLSAFACHPKMGSEDGVGWGWATSLSRYQEVHVLTREARRADIEKALSEQPYSNLHFHYVDPPSWLIFWKRGSRNFMLYAFLWQFFASFKAILLHQRERFDLVQHLTYGNLWLPSFLFLLPVPYIWGPVGGGTIPTAQSEEFRLKERVGERVRRVILNHFRKINIPILLGMRKARLVLARTEETFRYLPQWACRKAVLLPETAIDPSLLCYDSAQRRAFSLEEPFSVIYAGRILHWKNLHLAIDAFRKTLMSAPELRGKLRFDIYGDGPYMQVCRDIAGDEDGRSIIFHGVVDRALVLERLRKAHLFIHLSLKDTAATAPLEAMAMGVPVVTLKCGGMTNLVDDDCGFIFEPGDPSRIVVLVAALIMKTARDRNLIADLSLAAREKIEKEFTWERRIDQYQQILIQQGLIQ